VNIHDDMTDDEVLATVAGSLSASPVPGHPEPAAIMARGRVRRHRRRAGIGLAGVTAAAASAMGLAAALAGGPAPALADGQVHTTAFTLVKNPNGTVTLTLTMGQMFDPGALQEALARDGIPALVKIGTQCTSDPAPPRTPGILTVELPDGTPVTPGSRVPIPSDAVNVIDPAAIPTGTELFFDYLDGNHGLLFRLIDAGSYTCTGSS
jgi:hypothetical protein